VNGINFATLFSGMALVPPPRGVSAWLRATFQERGTKSRKVLFSATGQIGNLSIRGCRLAGLEKSAEFRIARNVRGLHFAEDSLQRLDIA